MDKKTVRDVEVDGKRVLVRVDFNVPLDREGRITNDARIRAALPTIQYLIEHKARVILCSHLGRPKGQVVDSLRLRPVAVVLSQLLGQEVKSTSDCVGPGVKEAADLLTPGQILLLENLRFHPEEEANDAGFAKDLASIADIYVNDAFGTAHRAHASTEGVTHYLPAVAGFLMEKELEALGRILTDPEHPFVAIIGGAKISSKIGVVRRLLDKVDFLLIGGGMASTLLKTKGFEVGKSLVELDKLADAQAILAQGGQKLLLPVDAVIAREIKPGVETKEVSLEQVPFNWLIGDIGPRTVVDFKNKLAGAKTVFWNGPLGVFEIPEFAAGTQAIVAYLATLPTQTIVGGGDSAVVVEQMGLTDKFAHVSTGGGASLEFLEGGTLPGVSALLDK